MLVSDWWNVKLHLVSIFGFNGNSLHNRPWFYSPYFKRDWYTLFIDTRWTWISYFPIPLKVVWHICKHSRSPWNFFCRWLVALEEYSESLRVECPPVKKHENKKWPRISFIFFVFWRCRPNAFCSKLLIFQLIILLLLWIQWFHSL